MLNKIKQRVTAADKKLLSANFIIFAIAKSCVFFGPLLLARQLPLVEYGTYEAALQLSMNIFVIIIIGIPASYPFFILKQRRVDLFPVYLFHSTILFFLGIIYGLLFFLKIIPDNYFSWVVCITLLLSAIFVISTIYKTHAKTIKAVIMDSIHYISITILCLFSYLFIFKIDHVLLPLLWGLYFLLAIYFFFSFKDHFSFDLKFIKNNYAKLIKYGIPAILTSFLIGNITGAGKYLIQYFISKESVGIYSFYFRLAGGAILIHQFVSVTFYKKIFITDKEKLDSYFYIFYASLLIINTVLYFFVPTLLRGFFGKLLANYDNYRLLYWMVSVQMILWIAMAMNESLIYRENLIKAVNIVFTAIVVGSASLALLLSHFITFSLVQLVMLHITILFFALETQFILLKRKKLFLNKSRIVCYTAYSLILIAFCISNFQLFHFFN